MSFYQIDSRQLRSKNDELRGLSRRFIKEKENLCAEELTLGQMWDGAANERFHTEFMKNAGQMDAFVVTVDQYLNVIERIAERYDLAEQKNMGRTV